MVGALAVIRYAERHGTRRPWLVQLLARRTAKIAAVALANKMARMIWAIKKGSRPHMALSAARTAAVHHREKADFIGLEFNLRYMVLVVFLRIIAEQHLDPCHKARAIKPDLSAFRVKS